MYQIVTTRGNRKVMATSNGPGHPFRSRLYVNGDTPTHLCKVHKTERGARKWAQQILDFSSVGL
jgi:hypothetical protein